jgi:hypothetical protein
MIGGSEQDLTAWTPAGQPRRRAGRIVYWVLFAISVALVAAVIAVAAATFRQYTDPTAAMEPTLTPGEHVLVTPGPETRRGDLIVFRTPAAPAELSLKRLIGLPGISLDSREWGPVPASAIAGHVFAMGRGITGTTFQTPRTYVTQGLAPPDHRVPPALWGLLLAFTGVVALVVLAVTGIVRSAIRRSRSRPRPPAGYAAYGPPA